MKLEAKFQTRAAAVLKHLKFEILNGSQKWQQ
jgi:hypothetical protein